MDIMRQAVCLVVKPITVPWVGLQYVIVVFPDHTHLLFALVLTVCESSFPCLITVS